MIAKAVDRSLDIYLNAIKAEDGEEQEPSDLLVKIGELAKKVGETNSTIRHYSLILVKFNGVL